MVLTDYTGAYVQPLTIHKMTKHIYGYDYEVVSTETATLAIKDFYAFCEVEDYDATPCDEQIWWHVADLNDHEAMWMNNCNGEILILTDGPESYYRRF